jgi:acyl phosphate:glycerol-3-phosphate acyltransferase
MRPVPISTYIFFAGLAYLLGSIPFGYILVRLFLGTDVRQTGSGNIGATNVARTGSKGLAVATLVLDILKGYVAVTVAYAYAMLVAWRHTYQVSGLPPNAPADSAVRQVFLLAAVAAFFAIIGHVFTVWLRFNGGKGVATGLGVFLALAPKAVLVVLAVFVAIVAVTRYISLGSMVAAALFPLCFYLMQPAHASPGVLIMISGVSLLVIFRHRTNIRRLLAGTENRFGAK